MSDFTKDDIPVEGPNKYGRDQFDDVDGFADLLLKRSPHPANGIELQEQPEVDADARRKAGDPGGIAPWD